MTETPSTRCSLLLRIRDNQDAEAWGEFVDIYAPLVYRLARRHGLQDADAADLTQEVLRSVARAAPAFVYDPSRGTFRGWLLMVARNQVRKWANARKRQVAGSGDEGVHLLLEEYPAPDEATQWDEDCRAGLFEWAAGKARTAFRPATWAAFWQTAVEGRDAAEVAAELGMSVGAVYIARSRVLARIRREIEEAREGCALFVG